VSVKAYVNLLVFFRPDGSPAHLTQYQNYFVNQTFSWNGYSYTYLPFACAAGAGSSGGERTGDTLVMGIDVLSASVASEAVSSDWRARIETVLLDPMTDAPLRAFTVEWWSCSSYVQKPDSLQMNLRSPFDAVANQYPGRVLSQSLVGTMPSTGNVVVGN
jgi:hypothetical protein